MSTRESIPPGFAQRYTFEWLSGSINKIAWSPDGNILASQFDDKKIRLWDAKRGMALHLIKGHTAWVIGLAWSPDGRILASCSADNTVRLWDPFTQQQLHAFTGHTAWVIGVAWSPDGRILASCSADSTVRLWDAQIGRQITTLRGHSGTVYSVAWSPDGQVLASSSQDKTIRHWNPKTGMQLLTLESHTGAIICISYSYDGHFLASKSHDGTVRIWRVDTSQVVAVLDEPTSTTNDWSGLAFHPSAPALATLGEKDMVIRIWDLDFATLLKITPDRPSIHYTTAKIALVGDGGVGKTGLGYRIAKGRFRITGATHGQQFWVVDKLGKIRHDGTQCEAVLWDFAGQPVFRPIHTLFLDDVDLALVLFDPSLQDTLTGVNYWLKQLSYSQQLCRTVLVAARIDICKLSFSIAWLKTYCHELNISGGFIATSAKTNEGVNALLEIIQSQIDWDTKTATVTSETFKRIKDYLLALKTNADRKNILVSPGQLRHQLEAADGSWVFSDAELLTAVGHLQTHGYVTILHRSSNEHSILLAPNMLINLAASYMHEARLNERGLGALEESRALRNEYQFPELDNLNGDEGNTLLNAVTELFLNRNICFREAIDDQTFLIFPSLILERPPLRKGPELVEDSTYIVTGLVENLYPALVVLLGYAPSYQRTNQWRKQAQYETMRGEICGFLQTNDDPEKLELVLYYGKNTPNFVRSRFQGLFEEILYTHQVSVKKYIPIICPRCNRQQERHIVIQRMQEGKTFLFCHEDGEKINLPNMTERLLLSSEDHAEVIYNQVLSNMRTTYETSLVRVKGFLRDRDVTSTTTCFVSYAWGIPEHEQWVQRLADDLRKADIAVLVDQGDNSPIGASISRFISLIELSDFIIVVGTPTYRQKYENKFSQHGSIVAAEVDLINVRLMGTEGQKASVLPLLLVGEERTSFPPLLRGRVFGNFTRKEEYFATLFDLVLTLYHIPRENPVVSDLRAKLRGEVLNLALMR